VKYLLLALALLTGCAFTPAPTTTTEEPVAEAVPEAPAVPEPPPRFLDCFICYRVRYIRDTYTGREYLCNTEGGLIEILPKGATK
jgi:hypothetical protein